MSSRVVCSTALVYTMIYEFNEIKIEVPIDKVQYSYLPSIKLMKTNFWYPKTMSPRSAEWS